MSSGRTALFVSLAVNLLLVGAMVGVGLSELRHQRERASLAVARAPNIRALMQSLPPERATEVRQKVIGAWRDARTQRRAARQARLDLVRIAGAETYDVAAAKAAFARMRAADASVAGRFQDVVADAMVSLTLEERRDLLRRLAARRADQGRRGLQAPDTGDVTKEGP